eukprot:XP_011438357.1 PREDICTED: uncharacterized protein LOC105335913 [Crassostrea gigas]
MKGFVPCYPQLPTLRSIITPEADMVKGLPTCFPTDCGCRKTESECFRTSGCSWCTSDKNGNLVKGFCDLKEICPSQQCLKDECSAKCCGSECHSAEQQSDGLLYVGISCGIVAAVIIFIMVIIFILRKIRREGKDETYIDPTHDFDTTNHHQPAGLNYIASPNYVGVEQDQLQIH